MAETMEDKHLLRAELGGLQILFICLSAVIGDGVLVDYGEALAIAGPVGLLLSVVIVGIVACSVAETVSGFVQLFPARNAVYQFTFVFLDEDLAWVVSLGYWYCFTAVFASEMVSGAKLLSLWQPSTSLNLNADGGLAVYLFYALIPTMLFTVNLCGVKVFGWIETVGGVFKALIVLLAAFSLYRVAAISDATSFGIHPPLNAEFAERICIIVPDIAFSYIGIESIIMAAFEGKPGPQRFGLKKAARSTHWIVFILYLLYAIGVMLAVDWRSETVSEPFDQHFGSKASAGFKMPISSSPVILAMQRLSGTRSDSLVSFANVCLVFCSLSAANTSIYIASRTMWGMAADKQDIPWLKPIFKRLAMLWESTGVPVFALLLSTWFILSVFPSTQFTSIADEATFILTATASESCIVVWLVICLSFLKFSRWIDAHPTAIPRAMDIGARPPLIERQPRLENIPQRRTHFWFRHCTFAVIGAVGSVFVFVCSSASLWRDNKQLPTKIIGAFGAQSVMLIAWLGTKAYKTWERSRNPDKKKEKEDREVDVLRNSLINLLDKCARHERRVQDVVRVHEQAVVQGV